LLTRRGQARQVGVAVEGDEFAAEVDGFLGGGEGLRAAPALGQADGEVADRPGAIGQIGIAGRGRTSSRYRSCGFFGRW
jgi:hypothetical protein